MDHVTEETAVVRTDNPKDVFRKTLDPGLTLPAAFFAQAAYDTDTDASPGMRVIGYGGCGVMFEQAGRTDVIKKAAQNRG
jgi:hypothetical protein